VAEGEQTLTKNKGATLKQILVLHGGAGDEVADVKLLGTTLNLRRVGHRGDTARARQIVTEDDGRADAVAVEGIAPELLAGAGPAPVVDGNALRPMLERWAATLVERARPGIFRQRRVLFAPEAGHEGLAQTIRRRAAAVLPADRLLRLGVPALARPAFAWADIVAGDMSQIRRFAPGDLRRKIVVVDTASQADLDDLRRRGAAMVIALFDSILPAGIPCTPAVVEAVFAALRPEGAPLGGDTYLDLLAELEWTPQITFLQPGTGDLNVFAFAIHPLNVTFIHGHPWFRWTRYLPDGLVEAVSAYFPAFYVGRISGGRSPATGQRIEGHLISLGATPRQMMRHSERFTYTRLNQAAKIGERLGARIMGLGAFTSVVGDAGITVAHEAEIAITSGNSLTVAATLEAAKEAVRKMGAQDLTRGRAMVIGATGSIGSVCARLLAQAISDVVLVSIEPEKLIALKRTIEEETPGAHVQIATRAAGLVEDCDLIVTATSAFGQRIVDISRCKPGAVICDVARPPDISAAEAALRPDVLVIESGEVRIPGEIKVGYNIGLPPGTVYACLAETALLAMEGRFEDYTLGRNITIERVKEIYHLFKKHGFRLAGLRSFGKYVDDEDVARRRAIAARLLADPVLLERTRAEVSAAITRLPAASKGVRAKPAKAPRQPAAAATAGPAPAHQEVTR
jgi:predicted amino acid dehydrogenase